MTIPASQIVSIAPSVLGAGGTEIDATGLVLTTNTRVPLGAIIGGAVAPSVLSFPSAAAVSAYFGASSTEARIAGGGAGFGAGYFGSFVNSTKLPQQLLFAQYNPAAVSAYVRGGVASVLSLAQLQALSGTLSVVADGYLHSGGTVSGSAAVSFSSMAAIIQTALNGTGAVIPAASFTGSIAGNILTVVSLVSGTIGQGEVITGTGGGGVAANTWVLSQLTGAAGGSGTYLCTGSQTVTIAPSMAATVASVVVAFDSVSGGFTITSGVTGTISTMAFPSGTLAPSLFLTQGSGAVLSQGAGASTPSQTMTAIVNQTTAFVCFMTATDPDGGVGNTLKQAFAAWKNTQNNRYAYICQDTDITPTNTLPANNSLGQILAANNDSGTCLIYNATDLNLSAFIMGTAASINFEGTNQRITFAFKAQAGLVASVSDPTIAANLAGSPISGTTGNNYNFYGAYAGANSLYTWFQRGTVTGTFAWLDSYVNQIVMNVAFQNALLAFLQNALSIPYTVGGNALIAAALTPVIQQFLNFGAFAAGPMSALQIAEVNAAAGTNIATTLQAQGYYLQILPAPINTRLARTSPPINFWYLDRGSVQAITLASIDVP